MQAKLRRAATIVLLACVAASTATAIDAPGAHAQTCHGTLAPAAGGAANDTKYSLTCDFPVSGRYTVAAVASNGAPLAGSLHNPGQGFSCSATVGGEAEPAEEPEESEENEGEEVNLSSWNCVGGSALAGTAIEGFFAARKDPCVDALSLRFLLYSQAGRRAAPAGRATLTIACSSTGGGGGGASKPVVSGVKVSPSTFRAAGHGASVATPVGTRVEYRLSIAARATFRVQRASAGALSGGRCVALTKANRARKRCTRYVAIPGSFVHAGAAGVNRLRFSGRLSGRRLSPGFYRLAVTARSGAGPVSSPVRSRDFHVIR